MEYAIWNESEVCPACGYELDCYDLYDYSTASEIRTECPNCGIDLKITAEWSVTYGVTLDKPESSGSR